MEACSVDYLRGKGSRLKISNMFYIIDTLAAIRAIVRPLRLRTDIDRGHWVQGQNRKPEFVRVDSVDFLGGIPVGFTDYEGVQLEFSPELGNMELSTRAKCSDKRFAEDHRVVLTGSPVMMPPVMMQWGCVVSVGELPQARRR